MNTEIVKIDPTEFGLQESEVQIIESAFMPKIAERDGLRSVYENLITKEITKGLCLEAKTVRKQLAKVRTGIAEVHKTQKAYYLAAGRYVDAWKNKETLPITQMEDALLEIEEYYDRIEAAKIVKLQEERSAEMLKYEAGFVPGNLGELTPEVWENFILGTKTAYEAKKAAEQEALRVEQERLAAEKAEQERIRIENEKLQKELAEAREKAEAEAKLAAEKLAESQAKLEAEAKAAQAVLEAQQAEARKEAELAELKLASERAEAQRAAEKAAKELAAQKAEKAKLEAELKAKADAEAKRMEAEKRAAAEVKAAQKAPDKEKLLRYATMINGLRTDVDFNPKLSSPEAQVILEAAQGLLLKISNFVTDKANAL